MGAKEQVGRWRLNVGSGQTQTSGGLSQLGPLFRQQQT